MEAAGYLGLGLFFGGLYWVYTNLSQPVSTPDLWKDVATQPFEARTATTLAAQSMRSEAKTINQKSPQETIVGLLEATRIDYDHDLQRSKIHTVYDGEYTESWDRRGYDPVQRDA